MMGQPFRVPQRLTAKNLLETLGNLGLIAPGSHKLGRIAESDVREVVRRCGAVACLAEPGDIWLYATPILHASEAATEPFHRRVLQIDFAVGQLPGGLEWLGI
jgi:ectoine hydroxylase-related dioxygenase (phytanoyl-CoA dioxygenase family)